MDVQIACLANIHNNKIRIEEMPKADILIIAGGATNRGTHSEYLNFLDSLKEWDALYEHIVYVPCKTDAGLSSQYWKYHDMLTEVTSVTILVNTDTVIKGVQIWGSSISKHDLQWSYTLKDPELERAYKLVPKDTDIFVTHSPAEGILDGVTHKRNTKIPTGCPFVAKTIERVQPKLHICGGAHESYGTKERHRVKYVNASLINKDREPKNEVISLTLEVETNGQRKI